MADFGSDLLAAIAGLSAEDRAGLVNSLMDKLPDLAADHSDFLETLRVRRRVDVLREIQVQHDELEAKFLEERAALEAKYQKLYEPFYTTRYEIVNGLLEVEGVSDECLDNHKNDQLTGEKGVPNFWLTAMKTNDLLAKEISERDEGALQHLKDIKWYRIDGSKGFKLEFFFDPNPYFKNSVLSTTYHTINEDELILGNATGTEIEWFPGKILTQKIATKKQKKGSKNLKPITKTEDCESFFNFFNPPQVPEDEETVEILQNQMEQYYEIGSTIRKKIIPHAVSWFTGEVVQDEEFEDTEDDEDGYDANNEDEDDEDENEEYDEEDEEGEEKGNDEDENEEYDEEDEEKGNALNKAATLSYFHPQPTYVTYVVSSPSYFHHQQQSICKIRWNFPPRGFFKLNTDGSFFRGSASFGGVIRDDSGRWVCGYMGKIPGLNTTSLIPKIWGLIAEIWGIYKGLLLIEVIGLKKVIIETDCAGALNIFSTQNHPLKDMTKDGIRIMKDFECVIFHTLREGNYCADQIAKLGRRQPEEFCFLKDVPDAAIPFLFADKAGVGFERPSRRQNNMF